MTNEILNRAVYLNNKITHLEAFLNDITTKPLHCFQLQKCKRKLRANCIWVDEYIIDEEEYAIIIETLKQQLEKYKDEYNNLKC